MTRKDLQNTYMEFVNAHNIPYAFYITYKETENFTAQKWGLISDLSFVLDNIEKCPNCIEGQLPIERMFIYSNTNINCLGFVKNPYWNCLNDPSEDSHIVVTIPYIAENGGFGMIVPEVIEKYENKH